MSQEQPSTLEEPNGSGGPATSQNRIIVGSSTGEKSVPISVKSQDVRVDNWGNYCLQRLQVMYDRGDFCDLILQFHTNNEILKVHRVVVNLCTEYFANHERIFGLASGMLVLPKDIEYSTMVTIVKFFYTGKLEIKSNQFNDIYRTVKLMNIHILTKLLESHARKPIAMAKKEPTKPIIFKQAVEIGRPLQKIQVHSSAVQQGSTIKVAPNNTTVTTSKNITRPLPPGVKTKTVLARVNRVQPQNTVRVTNHQGKLSTPKKLPIWKERKYAPATNSDPLMLEKWPPRDEPPRPTRFEWPDPDEDPYLTPATHTLMDRQKAAATTNRKAEDIFDAVKSQSQAGLIYGIKRSIATVTSTVTSTDGSPVSKIPKLLDEEIETSINSVDITSAEESSMSDVNLTDDTIEEEVSTTEGYHCQDSVESTTVEACSSVASSLFSDESSTSDISTTTSSSASKNISNNISLETFVHAKRSSIKSADTLTSSQGVHKIEKTVRFAPEVEKDKPQQITVPKSLDSVQSSSNHSKIISEVLKKYPDLVKDHKNIKLKIVQKESDVSTTTSSSSPTKDSKSKVSYIVLKSTSAPDSAGSVVLKKPSMNKSFWESDKSKKVSSGAENTTGPWLCNTCGSDDLPMEFESYYNFRRHLVDVHGERIDARICEYCGQKASKRNLVLYHLYTKHGVPPPKNCVFPHCDRCDYVALSESLLVKHKQGHDANKEFSCTICNASFKSNGALQGHMAANLHRNNETKVYECPYCRKPFVRNINLKAHIRSLHKEVARIEEMEDPRLPPDDSLSNRSVAIVHSGGAKKRQFPSILGAARLQSGGGTVMAENPEDNNMSQSLLVTADGQTIEILHGMHDPNAMSVPVLVPSSEADALSNVVATSIASLGLEAQAGITNITNVGGTEFVTGVNSDGSPAVFIMDSSQNAVEVDVSGVGMTDGSMIFEGDPTGGSDQFIVQDMQGNQFRKITAIDETGKQVIFFQLQDENGQVTMPAILDDSVARFEDVQGEGTAHFDFESGQATFSVQNDHVSHVDHMYLDPQKCSVFVTECSGGMTLPVTVSSDVVGGGQQVHLLSNLESVPPGHVIELVPATGESSQCDANGTIVTSESLLNQVQQGHVQLHSDHQHHLLQTGQVDHLGQPVQEVHIVLGQNHPNVEVVDKEEDTEMVVTSQGSEEKMHVIEQQAIHQDGHHHGQVEQVINDSTSIAEVVESASGDSSHITEGGEEQNDAGDDEQIQMDTSEMQSVQQEEETELAEVGGGGGESDNNNPTTTTTSTDSTLILQPAILEGEETGNGQVEFQECMQIVGEVQTGNGDVELQECLQSIEHPQHVEVEEVLEEEQTQQIEENEDGSVQIKEVASTTSPHITSSMVVEEEEDDMVENEENEAELQISENLSEQVELHHHGDDDDDHQETIQEEQVIQRDLIEVTSSEADIQDLIVEDAVVDV